MPRAHSRQFRIVQYAVHVLSCKARGWVARPVFTHGWPLASSAATRFPPSMRQRWQRAVPQWTLLPRGQWCWAGWEAAPPHAATPCFASTAWTTGPPSPRPAPCAKHPLMLLNDGRRCGRGAARGLEPWGVFACFCYAADSVCVCGARPLLPTAPWASIARTVLMFPLCPRAAIWMLCPPPAHFQIPPAGAQWRVGCPAPKARHRKDADGRFRRHAVRAVTVGRGRIRGLVLGL